MPTKRIGYIDALRGISIFILVMCHVNLFSSFPVPIKQPFVLSMMDSFLMPVFFFISGFVSYHTVRWDISYYFKMIKKKVIALVIPALIFWSLFHCFICYHGSLVSIITDGPRGYWFTIVLFYIFVIYYTVMYLFQNFTPPRIRDIALVSVAIIMAVINIGGMKFFDLNHYPILCGFFTTRHFEFFVLGVMCKKYMQMFFELISSESVKALIIVTFFVVFVITWNEYVIDWSLIQTFNWEFSLRYLALLSVFVVFYSYKDFFETETTVAKFLRFIGTRTLDIYLIHYFFINEFSQMPAWLVEGLYSDNAVIEYAIKIVIAIVVIALCLLVGSIIRSSSLLGHYLLGGKIVKN